MIGVELVSAWVIVLALLLFVAGNRLATLLGVLMLVVAGLILWFLYVFDRSVQR